MVFQKHDFVGVVTLPIRLGHNVDIVRECEIHNQIRLLYIHIVGSVWVVAFRCSFNTNTGNMFLLGVNFFLYEFIDHLVSFCE